MAGKKMVGSSGGFSKAKKDLEELKKASQELLKDTSAKSLGKESMKKKKNTY